MQTELPLFGMASSAVRNPAHFCCAGWENGPTLVIHKIVLEPCGNQSCTERTFTLRITGPSYPNGEIFTLRAGSCTQLDEPARHQRARARLLCHRRAAQLSERILHDHHRPVMGNVVQLTNSCVPTVVTIVNRKRLCRRRYCGG